MGFYFYGSLFWFLGSVVVVGVLLYGPASSILANYVILLRKLMVLGLQLLTICLGVRKLQAVIHTL